MIRTYSTTNYKLNQSEDFVKKTKLAPWWVTGIIDAGGKFAITLDTKVCFCTLEITQKEPSIEILYYLQEYFKCGDIILDDKQYDKDYKTFRFIVINIVDLYNNILPHFDKYPLVTSKNLDFLDFKKVVLMCKEGLGLFNIHRRKILLIKNNMNSKRSFDQRWDFNNRLKTQRLNNEWLQAFINIRGFFYFCVIKFEACLSLPCLIITLKNDEINLIYNLVTFFGPYYLPININDIKAIKSSRTFKCMFFDNVRITKFVDEFEMLTSIMSDYKDWKRLIILRDKKVYNTARGLWVMWLTKNSMSMDNYKMSPRELNKMPFNNYHDKKYVIFYFDFSTGRPIFKKLD